jgi:NAD(P) transhydrogenase
MSDNYLKEVKRLLESYVTKTDIIICSITDSGKSSPKIITKTMVKSMRKGSVIIDLYSDHGGNCELTM